MLQVPEKSEKTCGGVRGVKIWVAGLWWAGGPQKQDFTHHGTMVIDIPHSLEAVSGIDSAIDVPYSLQAVRDAG